MTKMTMRMINKKIKLTKTKIRMLSKVSKLIKKIKRKINPSILKLRIKTHLSNLNYQFSRILQINQ